jgi:gas vesicle protein
MSERNSGSILMAVILGGVVGAIAGILYAPRAGKETRKRLKYLGDDISEKLESLSGEVKDKTRHIIEEGREKVIEQKERIEEAIEAGRKAFSMNHDK